MIGIDAPQRCLYLLNRDGHDRTQPAAPRSSRASSSTSRTPRLGPSAPSSPPRCRPRIPGDSSLARAADALAAREFEVVAHTDGPARRRRARGGRRARHRPPLRPEVGGAPSTAARRCSTGRGDRRDRGLRPRRRRADRPRRDRAGQVRRQPQRAPRPLRPRDRERHASRTTSTTTTTPRPGCSPTLDARRPPARRRPARRRRRRLLLPRRHPHRGQRRPASSPARTRPPRPAGAPLAAVAEHGAGRVVVTADSDLFGDDCIGELDHERLWLNLLYWAAQPAFAAAAEPARVARHRRPGVGPPARTPSRSCA